MICGIGLFCHIICMNFSCFSFMCVLKFFLSLAAVFSLNWFCKVNLSFSQMCQIKWWDMFHGFSFFFFFFLINLLNNPLCIPDPFHRLFVRTKCTKSAVSYLVCYLLIVSSICKAKANELSAAPVLIFFAPLWRRPSGMCTRRWSVRQAIYPTLAPLHSFRKANSLKGKAML